MGIIAHSAGCQTDIAISVIAVEDVCLEELWHVEENAEDDDRNDVGEDSERDAFADVDASVENGVTDSQVPE